MNSRSLIIAEFARRFAAAYATDDRKPTSTPPDFAMSIVDKLPASADSVLVVSDLGFLLATIMRYSTDEIVFAANTMEQENEARSMGVRVFQLGYNNVARELKEKIAGMKFDIIVGNPPYGDLHLKILKECVEHLNDDGVCVTIQPVRWLQDPLWNIKKTTDAKRYRKYLDGRIDSVQVISGVDATAMFNATFTMDLGIFVVKAGGGAFDYESLSRTPRGVDLMPVKHILSGLGKFRAEYYSDRISDHFVVMEYIAGGNGRRQVTCTQVHSSYGYFIDGLSNQCRYGDGLTLEQAQANNKHRVHGKTSNTTIKSFSTPKRARNFYEYLRLTHFRFFGYLLTTDAHIHHEYLPIPADESLFDSPWDNARFDEFWSIPESYRLTMDDVTSGFQDR